MEGYAAHDSELPPEEEVGPFLVYLTFTRQFKRGELDICPGSLDHQVTLNGLTTSPFVCASAMNEVRGTELLERMPEEPVRFTACALQPRWSMLPWLPFWQRA